MFVPWLLLYLKRMCLLFITYIRILGTFKTITQVMLTRFKFTSLLSEASFVLPPWLCGMCHQNSCVWGRSMFYCNNNNRNKYLWKLYPRDSGQLAVSSSFFHFLLELGRRAMEVLLQMDELRHSEVKPLTPTLREH